MLYGFDFISYLKSHLMLGQVDPWRKTMEDEPIFTLLVTVDYALAECKSWSNQDISRQEFIDYLKINDIYLFKNIDEFKAVKEKKETLKVEKKKRETSPELREKRRNNMLLNRQNRKGSIVVS